ncbi:T9SS type A sorting domain-containing protein [Winogradskyella sp. PE311]
MKQILILLKFNSGVYTIEVETSQGKISKKLIIK